MSGDPPSDLRDPAAVAATQNAERGTQDVPAPVAPLGWRLLAGALIAVGGIGALQSGLLTVAAVWPSLLGGRIPGAALCGVALLCGVAGLVIAFAHGLTSGCGWRAPALRPAAGGVLGAMAGTSVGVAASTLVHTVIWEISGLPLFGLVVYRSRLGYVGLDTCTPWVGLLVGVLAAAAGSRPGQAHDCVRDLMYGCGLIGAASAAWGVAWGAAAFSWGQVPVAVVGSVVLATAAYGAVCVGWTSLWRRSAESPKSVGRSLGVAATGLVWAAGISTFAVFWVATTIASAPPEFASISGRPESPRLFAEPVQLARGALARGADMAPIPLVLLLVVGIAWFAAGRRAGAEAA